MKNRSRSLCLSLTLGALSAFASAGCGDHEPLEQLLVTLRDHHASSPPPRGEPNPACPDVCAALCAGEPEPPVPRGCPIPDCGCEPPPEETCPDACAVSCGRLDEEEMPDDCPQAVCDCSE